MFNKRLLSEIVKGFLLIIKRPYISPICSKWVRCLCGFTELSQELCGASRGGLLLRLFVEA